MIFISFAQADAGYALPGSSDVERLIFDLGIAHLHFNDGLIYFLSRG